VPDGEVIYLYIFLLVYILDYVQYKITAPSYSVGWSAYGGIAGVLRRKNFAPMQYRPLVPCLVGLTHEIVKLLGYRGRWQPIDIYKIGKNIWPGFHGGLVSSKEMPQLIAEEWPIIFYNYEIWKLLFMFLSFSAFHYFLSAFFSPVYSLLGVHLLAVAVLATFMYDSIECYAELFFFLLATVALYGGQPWFFVGAVFFGTLNRETAIVLPLLALLMGYWELALVGAVVFCGTVGMIRHVLGPVQHYCDLIGGKWMWKRNWDTVRTLFRAWRRGLAVDAAVPTNVVPPHYQQDTLVALGALGLAVLVSALAWPVLPGFLRGLVWLLPLMWGAHFLLGIFKEIRVVITTLIFVVPCTLYLMGA
jgi:hypothetical protein